MKSDDIAMSSLANPIPNCQLISCAEHEWQVLGPHAGDIGDPDDYCPFCLADEIQRLHTECGGLRELLAEAIGTIKVFHGPDAWDIYYNNAPEMKRFRAAAHVGHEKCDHEMGLCETKDFDQAGRGRD